MQAIQRPADVEPNIHPPVRRDPSMLMVDLAVAGFAIIGAVLLSLVH